MSQTLGSWLSQVGDAFAGAPIYAVIVIFATYYGSKIFYRLYLSPLSRIPGPKLAGGPSPLNLDHGYRATVQLHFPSSSRRVGWPVEFWIAATKWYAFYYEVICQGIYIWEVEKMHNKYGAFPKLINWSLVIESPGPIVRISPDTIHINDPEYIDHVFSGPGKKRDKSQKIINGLGGSPTVLGSMKHDLHRSRRGALNPFFSKQNIQRLEPTILDILHLMFQRLDENIESQLPINLGLLFRAATYDIISDYAFGEGPTSLKRPDLNQPYFEEYHQMVMTWHIGCYFPWIANIMRRLPPAAVVMLMPTARTSVETIEVRFFSLINLPTLYCTSDTVLGIHNKDRQNSIFHFRWGRNGNHIPRPATQRSSWIREEFHATCRRIAESACSRHW